MSIAPGTRLGTYVISGSLGAGGMGEVYRATDTRLGRDVALKVLPDALTASPDRLARLEREARTVAGLNHPNIVTLFSVEDEDGVRFLTMELVEGRSLDHLVAPGGLPVARVLELAIPLASALIAAHERGVVHRDLKPGNVMITHDGWVKVLDFGLAKLAAEPRDAADAATIAATVEAISVEGQVLGTIPYMAPEQIRGEAVDARSDLFALGIMLYELATGRRPFAGASPADVSSSILRDAPAPVMSLRADLPRDLNRIITRCLEKQPRDRFQTARDVYNELRYVQREIDSGASPAATATAFVALAPVSSSATAAPAPPSAPSSATPSGALAGRDAPSIAVLPFVNRSREADDEYFSDGLADELLNVLTKIRGLRVAARASSFQFKGKNEDLAVIGERLNVATLLDGSVRRAGNRVRISVQLVKAADRVQLWSETYDRSLDDIFAVQDDIAQAVVKELRTTLLGEDADSKASGDAKAAVAEAARGHGGNAEAHRLYLQGKYFTARMTEPDMASGIRYLQQALELDPQHAMAWAELAEARTNNGGYGWEPVRTALDRARDAVTRSLAIVPDLPEAYVAWSRIQSWYDWDLKAAERSARRALELAPGSTDALRACGNVAYVIGDFAEAERYLLRAAAQDPLSPAIFGLLGMLYHAMSRHDDAERALRKALELSPQQIRFHHLLAFVLSDQGRHAEAVAEAEAEPAEWARLTGLAIALERAGRRDEAERALRELEAKHAVDSGFQIAACHAVRGDVEASYAWLERGIAERDPGMILVKIVREFAPLHGDPRWPHLLARVGHGG
jgi:eukaryotic-like serine/threonine-protein kinase